MYNLLLLFPIIIYLVNIGGVYNPHDILSCVLKKRN